MIYVYINPNDGATYWTDKEEEIPENAQNLTVFDEPFSEVYRLRIKTLQDGTYEFYLEPKENIIMQNLTSSLKNLDNMLAETIKDLYPLEKQVSDKSDYDYYSIVLSAALEERGLNFSSILKTVVTNIDEMYDKSCEDYIDDFCNENNLQFILEDEKLRYGLLKVTKYLKRIYWLEEIRRFYMENRKRLLQQNFASEEEAYNALLELESRTIDLVLNKKNVFE